MTTEKIRTLHPQGRAGAEISRVRYDLVRAAILHVLRERGEIDFRALHRAVGERLRPFAGAVGWYTTQVKLDLEARGLIERIPGSMPQRLRLKRRR